MKLIAIFGLLAGIVLVAWGLVAFERWMQCRERDRMLNAPRRWMPIDVSDVDSTTVYCELRAFEGRGHRVIDRRQVGTIKNTDPSYDKLYLTSVGPLLCLEVGNE
jgi:hypothetical protein